MPILNGRRDLIRSGFLDVVSGAVQDHGPMIREGRLEARSFLVAKRDISIPPDDERRFRLELLEPGLHIGEKRAASTDLTRKDPRW